MSLNLIALAFWVSCLATMGGLLLDMEYVKDGLCLNNIAVDTSSNNHCFTAGSRCA